MLLVKVSVKANNRNFGGFFGEVGKGQLRLAADGWIIVSYRGGIHVINAQTSASEASNRQLA